AARNKRLAIAAAHATIALSPGGTPMSLQKHAHTDRIRGPGASRESRKQPGKSKAHGEREEHIEADNAREREQAKRVGNANIDQQGNRANVRQNTTRQGNRRSA